MPTRLNRHSLVSVIAASPWPRRALQVLALVACSVLGIWVATL